LNAFPSLLELLIAKESSYPERVQIKTNIEFFKSFSIKNQLCLQSKDELMLQQVLVFFMGLSQDILGENQCKNHLDPFQFL